MTDKASARPTGVLLDTAQGGGQEAYVLLPEESEDPGAGFVSEYEKAHPLVMPKGLTQVSSRANCTVSGCGLEVLCAPMSMTAGWLGLNAHRADGTRMHCRKDATLITDAFCLGALSL